MKNKKNIIMLSIILVILIFIGILYGIIQKNNDRNYISRQEWIEMLGKYTGAIEYSGKTPYFQDVDQSNEYYSYIQSAVEWEYIEKDDRFNGEKNATGEFIAITSIRSMGAPKIKLFLNSNKELNNDDYLKLALDFSLIDKKQLNKNFSHEEAIAVINKLKDLSYGEFWPKNLEDIEFQDYIKRLKREDIIEYDRSTNILRTTTQLKNNDIILLDNNGFVVAHKVISINAEGGYELSAPQLEEVFKSIRQSGVHELTFEDIINHYGEDNLISAKLDEIPSSSMAVSHTIGREPKSKGFKIEVEEENKRLKIYVTHKDTGIRYELPIKHSVSSPYKNFKTCIDVDKIFVGSQLDYSESTGINFASIAVDIETSNDIGLEAEREISDRILLFETPVPLGTGIIGIDIQVYLVMTLSGEFYLSAELPIQENIHFEKGKGIRFIHHDLHFKDPKIKANAEVKTKITFAPILVVAKTVPVIDMEIGTGVINKVVVEAHKNKQICTNVSFEYPVVDISAGQSDILYYGNKSLLASTNFSASWENIFKDKSFYKIYPIHHEVLPDGRKQYVTECTYTEGKQGNSLEFDFTEYIGTYKATDWTNDAYGGGEKLHDLLLDEEGFITGGGSEYYLEPFPKKRPLSIQRLEDGSYKCIVNEEKEQSGDVFYIYPKGIVEERFKDDEILTNSIYIRYVQFDGGVSDKIFYKIELTEVEEEGNVYFTKDTSIPQLAINYPNNWYIKKEELQSNYEWNILQNERGVEINYYSLDAGFGSQYYGGAYELYSVHITKVADSLFNPYDYQETSHSAFDKYVVAKLEVYAYEDGTSDAGKVEFDGPNYYAIIPENYLGDNEFSGMGHWALCSFEYVRPTVILVESPDGTFSTEEEEEIINILSSLKINLKES